MHIHRSSLNMLYRSLDTPPPILIYFFFFNDTATTEIYTLSLHDALPICTRKMPSTVEASMPPSTAVPMALRPPAPAQDRKSTRLNSSHGYISYAVFCLKKKKITTECWRNKDDQVCVNRFVVCYLHWRT